MIEIINIFLLAILLFGIGVCLGYLISQVIIWLKGGYKEEIDE